MRCGVPLLDKRVAPRCTAAEVIMVVTVNGGAVVSQDLIPVEITGPLDLVDTIKNHRIDTLICGGIGRDTRDTILSQDVDIVDNVACSAEEVISALERGNLAPGFGLAENQGLPPGSSGTTDQDGTSRIQASGPRFSAEEKTATDIETIDCLQCRDRVCLAGQSCLAGIRSGAIDEEIEARQVIETALDIAQERERRLCRVSEVVYFCLEMNYRRIGIAFCIELLEPAQILARVLRRFFDVVPVCCKIGGVSSHEISGASEMAARAQQGLALSCNPHGQAAVLNQRRTEFNLIVGLCIGADALLAHASRAPVSTLFVKDRSLANNPIGALYSDYYLRESASSVTGRNLFGDSGTLARYPRESSLEESGQDPRQNAITKEAT